MNNKNQNYLHQYLVNQLTEVRLELHKLSTNSTRHELEVWSLNGYYDGLVFRKEWLNIQLEELSKSQNNK